MGSRYGAACAWRGSKRLRRPVRSAAQFIAGRSTGVQLR